MRTYGAPIAAWVANAPKPTPQAGGGATKAVCDSVGNVIVTGYIADFGSARADILTIKYSGSTGAMLWQKRYNGPANAREFGRSVAVDDDNNVFISGHSENVAGNGEGYVAKYAATDGTLLWDKRHTGSPNGYSQIFAMALDGNNDVVIAGSIHNGSNEDFYTAKLAGANGALIWSKQYNGPANGQDAAIALAVDNDGSVAVTGNSTGSGLTKGDFYTAKYAGTTGALMWDRRHDELPGNNTSDDGSRALGLDGIGNVIVTGYTYSQGVNYNFYTAKYAAANGALLWEHRYDAPANHVDVARALAVDQAGNAIVTGVSRNAINNDGDNANDIYTAKYAAANGALIWERRYNGPANNSDEPYSITVDSGGNPVLIGSSLQGINSDFYTAKYAAANGDVLWEKIYNGPGNVDDVATGGALGPNGMIVVVGVGDRNPAVSSENWTANFTTVVYWESLPPVAITLIPAGVRLRFNGVPDHSYNIERAPAATGPWSIIATPTAPLDGLIEYTDTNPPTDGAFYRTSAP